MHFALWPAVFPVGIVVDGLADHRLEVIRDGRLFGPPTPVQRSRIEPLVSSRYIGASRCEAPNSVKVPTVRSLVQRPGRPLRELQRSLERIARMHRLAVGDDHPLKRELEHRTIAHLIRHIIGIDRRLRFNAERGHLLENAMKSITCWRFRMPFWCMPWPGAGTWPPIRDGVVHLSATQLAMLLDGLEWTRVSPKPVKQPAVVG